MRGMPGTLKKAAIVRFGALSMRMGVGGICFIPSRPDEGERRKAGEQRVANVVEFYVPSTFRKRVRWLPPEQRGKVIEFYMPARKKSA